MFSIANIAPVRDVVAVGQRSRDAAPSNPRQPGAKRLTPEQERLVQELAQTDQKVRAHEAAHQAAAGGLGGSASYSYQTGPDGKSYAVGGEVPVDISSGRTPEETISKAAQIRAAALAPADPSPQDLSVAAQASQMETAARAQLMQQQLAALHASKSGHSQPPAAATEQSGKPEGASNAGVPDVGAQAADVLAALESERAATGPTTIQVQHIARLAASAYGM